MDWSAVLHHSHRNALTHTSVISMTTEPQLTSCQQNKIKKTSYIQCIVMCVGKKDMFPSQISTRDSSQSRCLFGSISNFCKSNTNSNCPKAERLKFHCFKKNCKVPIFHFSCWGFHHLWEANFIFSWKFFGPRLLILLCCIPFLPHRLDGDLRPAALLILLVNNPVKIKSFPSSSSFS